MDVFATNIPRPGLHSVAVISISSLTISKEMISESLIFSLNVSIWSFMFVWYWDSSDCIAIAAESVLLHNDTTIWLFISSYDTVWIELINDWVSAFILPEFTSVIYASIEESILSFSAIISLYEYLTISVQGLSYANISNIILLHSSWFPVSMIFK